jgi:hypothetical protein
MERFAPSPVALRRLFGSLILCGILAGPAMGHGTISGTLTGPDDRSLAGARVNATDSRNRLIRVEVGADGAYTIGELEPGAYSLVVVGKGLETAIVRDLVVKEGETLTKDITLVEAKPFPVLRAAQPIPLTDDYNSTSFADAPEIRLDEAWQLRFGWGSGGPDNWGGPAEVSGKFRVKYSDVAIHLAADLTFKRPGVNNRLSQMWDGNAIAFDFQDDPYDPKRAESNLDHNWETIVALADPVDWRLFQLGFPPENQNPLPEAAKDFVLRKVKPNKDGELLRVDFPWSLFQRNASKAGAAPVPKEGTLGAMEILLFAADPNQSPEDAVLKSALGWSGYESTWKEPNTLHPIRFGAPAP